MVRLSKKLRRVVDVVDRRGLVVTLYPNGTVELRIRHTQRTHVVKLAAVYWLAVDLSLERLKREKLEKKRAEMIARGFTPSPRFVSRGLLTT